jgi:serpin B
LGFDLLRTDAYARGNVVLSPTSIAMALAMARAGAGGTTASQMDAVMHSAGVSATAMNSLDLALRSLSGTFQDASNKTQEVALHIADAPFAQKGLRLKQPYLDTLASSFGAALRLVDFEDDAPGALKAINGWVSEQTEKRIPSLLSNEVDRSTRLVLVNAIYMKTPWAQPFDPALTSKRPFTRLDGSTVNVPTMGESLDSKYGHGAGWQAVDLPYAGLPGARGSLTMTIIVPEDLADFAQSLTAERFGQMTGSMEQAMIDLTVPRFRVDRSANLAMTLAAMGMPAAFDGRADFSGITTEEKLSISAVVHQATVSVDETGTEATAASAVAMAVSLPPPATLHVDRPFIFAIRDTGTAAVLFLGRVVDPSS